MRKDWGWVGTSTTCLSCGHVDVVILRKNKHATKHFRGTEHPVIKSFEPDEDWKWCYVVKWLSTGEFVLSKLRTLLTFARWNNMWSFKPNTSTYIANKTTSSKKRQRFFLCQMGPICSRIIVENLLNSEGKTIFNDLRNHYANVEHQRTGLCVM